MLSFLEIRYDKCIDRLPTEPTSDGPDGQAWDTAAGRRAAHDDKMKWKHFPHYWPLCEGNPPTPVDSLHKGPVMRGFDASVDVSLNKQLNKQSRGW